MGTAAIYTDSPGAKPRYAERELLDLERRVPGALRAHILLVPRFGLDSASTQAFVDAVRPEVALIAAAPTKYGPPSDAVLERYSRVARKVLSTGLHPELSTIISSFATHPPLPSLPRRRPEAC